MVHTVWRHQRLQRSFHGERFKADHAEQIQNENWLLLLKLNLRFATESNFDCEQGNTKWVMFAQCWIDNLGFSRFKIPNFCIDPGNNIKIYIWVGNCKYLLQSVIYLRHSMVWITTNNDCSSFHGYCFVTTSGLF